MYCHQEFCSLTSETLWVYDELVKQKILLQLTENSVQLFHHLKVEKLLYVSASYTRGKRVSSFVKYLKDGSPEYGNIETFVQVDTCRCSQPCSCKLKHLAVIRRLQPTVAFQSNTVTVNHVIQCHLPNIGVDIVGFKSLLFPVYKSMVSDNIYLSVPLNQFELE